jgi:ATP-binding cassette subfamily B protein
MAQLPPPPTFENLKIAFLELQRAVRLVWSSAPRWTASLIILLLIQGLLPLAALYVMKLLVDGLTARSIPFSNIATLVALAGLVGLITFFCRSASDLVREIQASLVSYNVQDILHTKSIALDLEYYENPLYQDSLHRAQAEAPSRPTRIVNELAQLGQNGISMIGVAVLLVSYNWLLAVILLMAALPSVFVRLGYSLKLYNWKRSVTEKERQAWYLHDLLIGANSAKEIRLFDLGHHLKQQHQDLLHALHHEKFQISSRRSSAEFLAQSVSILALFGSLLFIARQGFEGIITVGSLVMYFGAFQQGQGFLQNMMQSLVGLYEDNLFLTDLYEFLDLEPSIKDPEHPRPVPQIKDGIKFENVSFRYPDQNHNALEDISLFIKPGQTIALVGENGSGKTTLIKLFCRLYDPQIGRITVDGVDLRCFSLLDWHNQIGVILQDYMQYSMTVHDNIWMGDMSQPASMSDIERAAEFSGASDFIKSLKDGYHTLLGRRFKDGVQLSIGQWQKIALARAFLRPAQVLVLDEPTSSLDPSAEEQIFTKFRELVKGRTAILISHRLSTVRTADCIYFMKSGRIVERGTHDELIEKNGEYAHLFQIQAKHYF